MQMLSVFFLLAIWGVVRRRRRGGKGRSLLDFAGLAGLFLWCWPPVAWLSVASLEKWYPAAERPPADAQAIVLLGASLYSSNRSQPRTEPAQATYLRATRAAWLFHHWKPLPIVVSGGLVGEPGDAPVADIMRRVLLAEGVPDSSIWVENRSANTYQNAVDTARILLPKGIRTVALVTEGYHMPRSVLCFRKQGFDVVAAGCAYRTLEPQSFKDMLQPKARAVHINDDCLHEWIGIVWYKLRGRI